MWSLIHYTVCLDSNSEIPQAINWTSDTFNSEIMLLFWDDSVVCHLLYSVSNSDSEIALLPWEHIVVPHSL